MLPKANHLMRSKLATNVIIVAIVLIVLIYIFQSSSLPKPPSESESEVGSKQKQNPAIYNPTEEDRKVLTSLWEYVYDKKYHCMDEDYIAGVKGKDEIDGAYYLCKDKQHWPFPATPPSDKCLVYSFGIDWDFKFDDLIAKMGCEVHAFDPSMNLTEGTKRSSGVIFHKIGIAEKDNDSGFKGWKMRTLKTLMKELGHETRSLDYLKVDTDKGDGTGFEDTIMHELLDTGLHNCVRQYAMEIHLPGPLATELGTKRTKDIYSLLMSLEKEGFRLYQTVDNARSAKYLDPSMSQTKIKINQFNKGYDVVLWENHFVNIGFQGPCREFLQ